MPPHIELYRTFWPLGDGDEYDPDTLRARVAYGLNQMRWSDLLDMTRVIILAEAGTGKTHELRETARRLRREGKAAVFCRIEELAVNGLENALLEGNVEEFRNWKDQTGPTHPLRLCGVKPTLRSVHPYPFSSFFSSLRKRQSVPWAMICFGVALMSPASCIRRAKKRTVSSASYSRHWPYGISLTTSSARS